MKKQTWFKLTDEGLFLRDEKDIVIDTKEINEVTERKITVSGISKEWFEIDPGNKSLIVDVSVKKNLQMKLLETGYCLQMSVFI